MKSVNEHLWWLASRASGIVALGLVTVSVAIGLLMAGKIMRRPGLARKLTALHEQTALVGLIAIGVHGVTLLGDSYLRPGIAGIALPGVMGYRPLWTSLGIVAGYLAAALGLSFYLRRRIGPRLWRRAHRATIVAYGLSVVHTLGAGTDAGSPWLQVWLFASVPVITGLFLARLLTPRWRRWRARTLPTPHSPHAAARTHAHADQGERPELLRRPA